MRHVDNHQTGTIPMNPYNRVINHYIHECPDCAAIHESIYSSQERCEECWNRAITRKGTTP